MDGEEIAGPASPKVLRLFYFVDTGFIYTTAINKWRELERKSLLRKQHEESPVSETSPNVNLPCFRMYHDAISCYEKALTLSNRSLSTYAGLAYTYHLQDNFSGAITYYHKALWLKPDDQFCTEMLSLALVDEGRHGIDSKIEFR